MLSHSILAQAVYANPDDTSPEFGDIGITELTGYEFQAIEITTTSGLVAQVWKSA